MVLTSDLVIAGAASFGLLTVRRQILPMREGLAWRFRLILLVSALFYLFRAADWLFDSGLLRSLTIASAGAIPFISLLLTEGMLRRHAPQWIKLIAALGLGAIALTVLVPSFTRSMTFLVPFLIYQIALFVICMLLILRRDRTAYSRGENILLNRIALIAPVIVLLLISDYKIMGNRNLPDLSGLAALLVAWIASTWDARALNGAFLLSAVAGVALVAGISATALGLSLQWGGLTYVHAGAMISALCLTLLVWLSSGILRRARARRSLDHALSQTQDLDAYLAALSRSGLSEGFTLLGPQDLTEYSPEALGAALSPTGGLRKSALPADPGQDTLGQSQARALLTRFAAQELIEISNQPLRLAIGAPSGLADGASAEVGAAFAIARLIAQRDRPEKGTP